MSKNNYKSKRRWKTIGKVVLVVLSIVLSLGTIAALTGSTFENPFKKERNDKNLLVVNETYIKTQNTGRGIEIDVKDDGRLTLKGKATSAITRTVQTLELQPGTYTISGVENPDVENFMLAVSYGTGDLAIAGLESATFTIAEAQTVTVQLIIGKDYKITFADKVIEPVLANGENAVDFWAE